MGLNMFAVQKRMIAEKQLESINLNIIGKAKDVEYWFSPNRGLRNGPVFAGGLEISIDEDIRLDPTIISMTLEIKFGEKSVYRYCGVVNECGEEIAAKPEDVQGYISGAWVGILDSLYKISQEESKRIDRIDKAANRKKVRGENEERLKSFGLLSRTSDQN